MGRGRGIGAGGEGGRGDRRIVDSKSPKGGGWGGMGWDGDEVHMRILFDLTNKGEMRGPA